MNCGSLKPELCRCITALLKELLYKRTHTALLKPQLFEAKVQSTNEKSLFSKVYSNKLD